MSDDDDEWEEKMLEVDGGGGSGAAVSLANPESGGPRGHGESRG